LLLLVAIWLLEEGKMSFRALYFLLRAAMIEVEVALAEVAASLFWRKRPLVLQKFDSEMAS